MPHINDNLAAVNRALATLQASVDALISSRSGLTAAEISARINAATQVAVDTVLTEIDNYDVSTIQHKLAAVKQVLDINNAQGDERRFYEFFRQPFTAADADKKCDILGTVAGDNSVDVSDTSQLAAGETYVLSDADGSVEVLEIAEILTATRLLATADLARSRTNQGTLWRTSWDLTTAGKAVVGNGAYYSHPLDVLAADDGGRLLVRRDAGDGTLEPYVRRIVGGQAQAWQACAFVGATAVDTDAALVDQLWDIPCGGPIELRIDSKLGPSGRPFTLYYLVAQTPYRAGRADSVRRPKIIRPTDGETGVTSDTPTITGDAYYSLYGVEQAGAELQIATDPLFGHVAYSAQLGAVTSHIVAADNLAVDTSYFVRLRYSDAEGTVSPWSETIGFSTGAYFEYVLVPTVSSPAEGAARVSLTPTLTTSNFATLGRADAHVATQYQVATDAAFAELAYDSGDSADLTTHTVPQRNALARETTYYLRVRHLGETLGYSGWSATRVFATINAADAPVITSPEDGSAAVLLPVTVTTSAFAFPGGGDAHIATQYQVATDAAFAELAYDSGDSTDLTTHTVPTGTLAPLTTYYFRARHKGAATGYSAWSSTVIATTQAPAGEQIFTAVGSHSWTVPDGVTSVSVVCVGGGGGGCVNNATEGHAGGSSSFGGQMTATGGAGGVFDSYSAAAGGSGSGGDGGGLGGDGCWDHAGGAAGYTGSGGQGAPGSKDISAATGGGGSCAPRVAGGGGVGIYGQGESGVYTDDAPATIIEGYNCFRGGDGGSGGAAGEEGRIQRNNDGPTKDYNGGAGGRYGGGGGGACTSKFPGGAGGGLRWGSFAVVPGAAYTIRVGAGGNGLYFSAINGVGTELRCWSGAGGQGAVRIIWGAGRSYPDNAE